LIDFSIFETSRITAPTFLNAKQAHHYTINVTFCKVNYELIALYAEPL
jgi:hypothetical protein